jgi:hypothetical protein
MGNLGPMFGCVTLWPWHLHEKKYLRANPKKKNYEKFK